MDPKLKWRFWDEELPDYGKDVKVLKVTFSEDRELPPTVKYDIVTSGEVLDRQFSNEKVVAWRYTR